MLGYFNERSSKTERLDRGEFTGSEYRHWQKEMWFVHRVFGEVRALKKSLIEDIKAVGHGRVSVLEVAAGSGELLNYVKKRSGENDIFAVGAEMSEVAARSIGSKSIEAVRCDALALPFADNSFDFVFCTLFLHHLSESQAADALRRMALIARRKLFVIDLDRRALPYFAYRIIGSILLQPFTREDGALSILRAYRSGELAQIASEAGLKNIEIRRSAINRLILSASV